MNWHDCRPGFRAVTDLGLPVGFFWPSIYLVEPGAASREGAGFRPGVFREHGPCPRVFCGGEPVAPKGVSRRRYANRLCVG